MPPTCDLAPPTFLSHLMERPYLSPWVLSPQFSSELWGDRRLGISSTLQRGFPGDQISSPYCPSHPQGLRGRLSVGFYIPSSLGGEALPCRSLAVASTSLLAGPAAIWLCNWPSLPSLPLGHKVPWEDNNVGRLTCLHLSEGQLALRETLHVSNGTDTLVHL